jgi:hypothetical protein
MGIIEIELHHNTVNSKEWAVLITHINLRALFSVPFVFKGTGVSLHIIVTRIELRLFMNCGWITWKRVKYFFLLTHVHSVPGAHPLLSSVGAWEMFPRANGAWGWGMMLAMHLHLVLRFRMAGAIPSFPFVLYGLFRDKFMFTFFDLIMK